MEKSEDSSSPHASKKLELDGEGSSSEQHASRKLKARFLILSEKEDRRRGKKRTQKSLGEGTDQGAQVLISVIRLK